MVKPKTQVKRMDDDYLKCRENHLWEELDPEIVKREHTPTPFGWLRVFVCERCDTTKRQIIDTYGRVTSNSYRHPDDYSMDEPIRGKTLFRQEIARRRGVQLVRLGRKRK